MLFVVIVVKLTSPGPILYWSDRVGKNNSIFKMPKFRTMRTDTPDVATHLLDDPDRYLRLLYLLVLVFFVIIFSNLYPLRIRNLWINVELVV